jgi:hypothetical protein
MSTQKMMAYKLFGSRVTEAKTIYWTTTRAPCRRGPIFRTDPKRLR